VCVRCFGIPSLWMFKSLITSACSSCKIPSHNKRHHSKSQLVFNSKKTQQISQNLAAEQTTEQNCFTFYAFSLPPLLFIKQKHLDLLKE